MIRPVIRQVGCVLALGLLLGCNRDDGSGLEAPDAGAIDVGPQFLPIAVEGLSDPKPNFFGIWGTSTSDFFLVGERGTIAHWDGSAWTLQPTPPGTPDLRSVWGRKTMGDLPAADDVWAVGNGGTVLHYTQGSWVSETSTTTNDLHAVAGRGGGNARVWAVGVDGVVATKDLTAPTARWEQQRANTFETLNGLWIRGDDGVAVGNLGAILRYDNANETWNRQFIAGLVSPLQGVWGTGPDQLWIVGLDGLLMRSSGMDFEEVTGAPRVYLRKVAGLGFGEVYFTGWGGVIGNAHGSEVLAFDQFSNHRLEGIWATTQEEPVDPNDPDAGVYERPRYYIVGVTGTVLLGP